MPNVACYLFVHFVSRTIVNFVSDMDFACFWCSSVLSIKQQSNIFTSLSTLKKIMIEMCSVDALNITREH
jgi:hypothetical protein